MVFRIEREVSSRLPKISVISPSPGGIPVAFGVREALSANQIYWAELENGERKFRQYVKSGDVYPCILVDDIVRTGKALEETVKLLRDMGADVIGCGAVVRFQDAPKEVAGVPIKSLVEFDCNFYDTFDELQKAEGVSAEQSEEKVRF